MLLRPGVDRLEKIDKYLETLPMDEALRLLLMLEDPKQEIPEKLKVNLSDKESEQK